MTVETDKLLERAILASFNAGKAILEVYDSDFTVENKKDNSPLTLADKRAHEIISDVLSSTKISLLSEEGKAIPYSERKQWGRFWLIDPLDGTKEFINRNGEFTVNIALIENNKPVMGVIYVPVKKTLYYASKEMGSYKIADVNVDSMVANDFFLQAQKLPVKNTKTKFAIVSSRSHATKETENFISEMQKIHGEINCISAGSSLKMCYVAEGSADVYPRFGPTMEWDTAAGQVIAECAGKQFIDCVTKNPMTYNKEVLLNNSFIVR